jgi:hypothetical protein
LGLLVENLENETGYSLCVSFEVLDAEIPIYKLLSEVQTGIEQEEEVEL